MTPITPTPDQLREIAAGLREGDLEVDVELIDGAAMAMEDLAAVTRGLRKAEAALQSSEQAREAAEARAENEKTARLLLEQEVRDAATERQMLRAAKEHAEAKLREARQAALDELSNAK